MFTGKLNDKCLISLFNHIGIETGNRKESESISRIGIGIGIDKIQTIPNPTHKLMQYMLVGFEISTFYYFCSVKIWSYNKPRNVKKIMLKESIRWNFSFRSVIGAIMC